MEEIPHQFLSTGRSAGKSLLAEALKRYEEEAKEPEPRNRSERRAFNKKKGGDKDG